METKEMHGSAHSQKAHYKKLALMIALSFIAMYILMYSMTDSFSNAINNINQVYMAVLMTAAMVILELLIMGGMYRNKKVNLFIISVAVILLILSFLFIRKQTMVGDKQFLRSMIPHHAAAVLMVKETKIRDPEIQKLADGIIATQQQEIEFMKAKLKELENK